MTVIYPTENYYDSEDKSRSDRLLYDLDEEKKIIAEATEEIKKELQKKWHKRYAGAQIFPIRLSGINPDLVDLLLSFDNTLFYNDLANKFNLNQNQRDEISQVIWKITIEKKWDSVTELLSEKLNLNSTISEQIAQLLRDKILFKAKELSEVEFVPKNKVVVGIEKESIKIEVSLLQAIQQFSNLGEQLVTLNPIKLKIFPTSVRPSIKNWIEDYRQTMGIQKHGMMERGNYLFHSDNGKFLTSGERKKLAEILRSLDEDVTLKIDPERQEVVFDMDESKIINQESSSLITNNQDTRYKKISNFNSEYSGQVPNKNNRIQNQSSNSQTQRPQAVNPNFQPNFRPTFVEKKPDEKVMPSQNYQFSQKNQPSFQQNQKFANYQPYAGKSWEEVDKISEPKVKGNTVDLRN